MPSLPTFPILSTPSGLPAVCSCVLRGPSLELFLGVVAALYPSEAQRRECHSYGD